MISHRQLRHPAAAAVALTFAAAALVSLLALTAPFHYVDLKAYDAYLSSLATRRDSRIVLVLMDDKTRTVFREPMLLWNRHYADLFRGLAGAGASGNVSSTPVKYCYVPQATLARASTQQAGMVAVRSLGDEFSILSPGAHTRVRIGSFGHVRRTTGSNLVLKKTTIRTTVTQIRSAFIRSENAAVVPPASRRPAPYDLP